jgi:Tol biopolymer transport system component
LPGFDDRLRQNLERLAPPADPSGAFDRVLEKKIRRRIARRAQAAGLAVAVVAATVGGTFALTRIFRSNGSPVRPGGISPTPVPVANGLIAYASLQSGNYDIWTAFEDGRRVDNITAESLAEDTSPAWSPDGTRIAFVSDRDGNPEIYVMNPQGTEATRLTHDPGIDQDPAWSPDGSKIAYVSGDDADLFVMNADGSDATRLTSGSGQDRHPTWAPDGSRIAFARLDPDIYYGPGTPPPPTGGIYMMKPDGADLTRLTKAPEASIGVDDWPDWSPDGSRIAFGRVGEIYVMDNDGSGLAKLTDSEEGNSPSAEPAWSPDGKKIVFERVPGGDASYEIFTMNSDGTDLTQTGLTAGHSGVIAPDWQPVPVASSPSPPPANEPSPRPTPSPLPDKCDASQVTGDFNGDRTPDLALVAKTDCLYPLPQRKRDGDSRFTTEYALRVQWPPPGGEGHPSEGMVPMPDCQVVCRAVAATDLNLDGIDELVVKIDEGASPYSVQFYELPEDEAFGDPANIAPPGASPDFPSEKTARFAVGGSVTHYVALGCEPSNQQVIVEIADLNPEQTEYSIHKVVLRFDPLDAPPFGQFTVTSTSDSNEPFDPNVGPGDRFEPGAPCWIEAP